MVQRFGGKCPEKIVKQFEYVTFQIVHSSDVLLSSRLHFWDFCCESQKIPSQTFDIFNHHFVNFIVSGSLLRLPFLVLLGTFSQILCIVHHLHTLNLLLYHLAFFCGVRASTMKQTQLLGRGRQWFISIFGTFLSWKLIIGFFLVFLWCFCFFGISQFFVHLIRKFETFKDLMKLHQIRFVNTGSCTLANTGSCTSANTNSDNSTLVNTSSDDDTSTFWMMIGYGQHQEQEDSSFWWRPTQSSGSFLFQLGWSVCPLTMDPIMC